MYCLINKKMNSTVTHYTLYRQMQRIFSFSGRKQSGKTLLAKTLEKRYNFKILNFADPIKNVASTIFDITRSELERQKDFLFHTPILLSPNKLSKIHDFTGIQTSIINEKFKQPITSIRQFLQILGTDLIRKYNPDWHISKTKIEVYKNRHSNICFADTRFKNEIDYVKSLKGEAWFIIRIRGYSDLSQHASETSLSFEDFDNVVINNGADISRFISKWTNYIDNGMYPGSVLVRYPVIYNYKLAIVLGALSSGECIDFINDTPVFKFKNKRLFVYFNECFPQSLWSDAALIEYLKKHGIIPFKDTYKSDTSTLKEQVDYFWNLGYIYEKWSDKKKVRV